MADDIVERLRDYQRDPEMSDDDLVICGDAADEIERLRAAQPVHRRSRAHGGRAVVSGDIVERLRLLGSIDCPYGCDVVGNPAADEIERLRAENALLRRVVVDLWDHMDDQSCIEFSAIRPRSYIVADEAWQADKRGGPS